MKEMMGQLLAISRPKSGKIVVFFFEGVARFVQQVCAQTVRSLPVKPQLWFPGHTRAQGLRGIAIELQPCFLSASRVVTPLAVSAAEVPHT